MPIAMGTRMLSWGARLGVLAVALLGPACGSDATGITVTIQPNPVQAQRATGSAYTAGWDVVVVDLTGVGGTLESVDATVGPTTVASTGAFDPDEALSLPRFQMEPFARRVIHQTASFTLSGDAETLVVTARLRDESGQTHEATARARLDLR